MEIFVTDFDEEAQLFYLLYYVSGLCNYRYIKVKNDPRSEFSNLSNWKEEA